MNGPWKAVQDTMNSIQILDERNEVVAELVAESGDVTDKMRVDSNLTVAAVNACIAVNPDNPMAAAESTRDMYDALKGLVKDGVVYEACTLESSKNTFKVLTKVARAKEEQSG